MPIVPPDPLLTDEPTPPVTPPDPAAPPAPAPAAPVVPPAAHAVITGTRTERELELEAENQRLADEIKARELEVAAVTDEFHTYKKTVEARPAPKKRSDWGPVIQID